MDAAGIDTSEGPNLPAVVRTLQERARTMLEMVEAARFYYVDNVEIDPTAAEKFLTEEKKPVLEAVVRQLRTLDQATEESIGEAFGRVMEETGLKLGKIGPTVRVALTGCTSSPGIYEVITVLGIEESCRRLQRIQESL